MGWIMAQGWGMLRHGWGGVLEGWGGVLKTGKSWEVGMVLFSFQPHFSGAGCIHVMPSLWQMSQA